MRVVGEWGAALVLGGTGGAAVASLAGGAAGEGRRELELARGDGLVALFAGAVEAMGGAVERVLGLA